MDKKLKENLDKLILAGKENGGIRTTTIVQLLNDLKKYSEQQYNEAIGYLEEKGINLIVDSTEERKLF